MAFTKDSPIRTVLYPFAEYSPEYQAIVWAKEHGAQCRFMDLPRMCFWESGGPGRVRRPRNIRPALRLSMCTGFWTV